MRVGVGSLAPGHRSGFGEAFLLVYRSLSDICNCNNAGHALHVPPVLLQACYNAGTGQSLRLEVLKWA